MVSRPIDSGAEDKRRTFAASLAVRRQPEIALPGGDEAGIAGDQALLLLAMLVVQEAEGLAAQVVIEAHVGCPPTSAGREAVQQLAVGPAVARRMVGRIAEQIGVVDVGEVLGARLLQEEGARVPAVVEEEPGVLGAREGLPVVQLQDRAAAIVLVPEPGRSSNQPSLP